MTRSCAVGISLLAATLSGCAAPGDDAANQQDNMESIVKPLYEGPSVVLWPGGQVPVCFGSRPTSTEALWVQQVLSRPGQIFRDSWSAVATIDFTFQNSCPFTGKSSWVELDWVHYDTWQGPYGGFTTRLGTGPGATTVQIGYCDSTDCLSTSFDDYKEEVRQTTIHEMGHVLGFEHEQQRPDYTTLDCEWDTGTGGNNGTVDGGIYLSVMDKDSVMNYCRRSIIHPGPNNDEYIGYEVGYHGADTISAGDSIGAQTAYPPKRFAYWLTPASQGSLL